MNSYFICATQYYNLGDLVINKMLIDEMSLYGKVYVDMASTIPIEFKQHLVANENVISVNENYGFSVRTLQPSAIRKFILLLRRYRIKQVLRSPGPLVEPNKKIAWGFAIINKLSRCLGAKVCYYGNCCSGSLAKKERITSLGQDAVFLRSPESVDYARNFLHTKVSFIPDLAFLFYNRNWVEKNKIAVVNFRDFEKEREEQLSLLRKILDVFERNNYHVCFYYQVSSDRKFAEELFYKFKSENYSLRKQIVWYNDIENFYKDKAFVISNRLHSLILGSTLGCIPIPLVSTDSNVQKIKHVFDCSFSKIFSTHTIEDIATDIEFKLEHEEDLRELLEKDVNRNVSQIKEIIKNNIDSLFGNE